MMGVWLAEREAVEWKLATKLAKQKSSKRKGRRQRRYYICHFT